MVYRETFFVNPTASSSYIVQKSQILGFYVTEDTLQLVMSEDQTPFQDLRCQSGPSAKKYSHP